MNIRIADTDDAEQVVTLVNDLIREMGGMPLVAPDAISMCRKIASGEAKGTVVIAENSSGIIGICTMSYQDAIRTLGRYAIIQEMYVAPEHRSAEVGAKLIDRSVAEATANGCSVIEVGAPPSGDRAQQFYGRLGFVHAGPRLRLTAKT